MVAIDRKPRFTRHGRKTVRQESLRRHHERLVPRQRRERVAVGRDRELRRQITHETVTHTRTSQDLDKDDNVPTAFQPAPIEEIFEMHREEQAEKKRQEKKKQKRLQALGFLGDSIGEGVY